MIVTRLDRLARSTRDLLNILDKIAKAGATFRSDCGPNAQIACPDFSRPAFRCTLQVRGRLRINAIMAFRGVYHRTIELKRPRGDRPRTQAGRQRDGWVSVDLTMLT